MLFGRVKDKLGCWSQTFRYPVEVIAGEDSASVVKVEYFFASNDDKGFGSCFSKPINIAPPFANDSVTFYIPYNKIPFVANDTLFLRVKEGLMNRWSQIAFIDGLQISTLSPRISQITESNNCRIYPNPTNEQVNIDFSNALDEPVTLTLTNCLGAVLQQETIQNQLTKYNLHQKPGIYFVNLKNTTFNIISKIIIE